jgi:hypothetical protein
LLGVGGVTAIAQASGAAEAVEKIFLGAKCGQIREHSRVGHRRERRVDGHAGGGVARNFGGNFGASGR